MILSLRVKYVRALIKEAGKRGLVLYVRSDGGIEYYGGQVEHEALINELNKHGHAVRAIIHSGFSISTKKRKKK